MSTSLVVLVQQWLRVDKEETTRNEIESLWKEKKIDELENRLRKRIEFGTAGLRGRMEAGFSRMNSLIVIQTSQGLASYVLDNVIDAKSRGVVIGHDHRHNSEHWANLTAAAFLNFGFKVYLHRGLVHTPLVPFSISRLKAACGVMITASHNPKEDNGYKVYWENSIQIIAPHDMGISNSIMKNLEPRTWDVQKITSSPLLYDKTEEMQDAYFSYLRTLSYSSGENPDTTIKFVITAMHGLCPQSVPSFGFPPFTPVESQKIPDPNFPTVRFPNPEEKGALDIAIEQADNIQADYVLAQDPDADRFAAAERCSDGEWIMFSGDMLGVIFASRVLEAYRASEKPLNKLAMVASTVSSKMIESMAAKEGFKFVECLTGFKYIGNTAADLVRQGYEVPFAYEEAIGFMFGSEIQDKDGIAATVFFAELASDLRSRGLTVSQYLNQLYSIYGYFQTNNNYFICGDPAKIEHIFTRLRNYRPNEQHPNYPLDISGLQVTAVRDLTIGYDSANPPTYKPRLPLSSGQMIQFRAISQSRTVAISLTIRTSGTEPKIKYYLEGNGQDVDSVKMTLGNVVKVLTNEWIQLAEN